MKTGKQPWVHIRVRRLAWMCHYAPSGLRWSIVFEAEGGMKIAKPGTPLRLKIAGGCWLQRVEKND